MKKSRQQAGIALAIVLWFLAGMCLLVSGITYIARVDTQMAQLHLAKARAAAAGDGAILLMLAGLVSSESSQPVSNATIRGNFTLGQQEISVVAVPTNGLVNLNTAPVPVLASLFASQEALDNSDARLIARSVVDWRHKTGPHRAAETGGRFQSTEDVLQVPGVTRRLWDAVRDYVVVEGGSGSSSPNVAMASDSPRGVSGELGFNAAPGALQRVGGEAATPGVEGGDSTAVRSWRVDALVDTGGQIWLRRKWVALGAGADGSLPWHYSRVEAPRVVQGGGPADKRL